MYDMVVRGCLTSLQKVNKIKGVKFEGVGLGWVA